MAPQKEVCSQAKVSQDKLLPRAVHSGEEVGCKAMMSDSYGSRPTYTS